MSENSGPAPRPEERPPAGAASAAPSPEGLRRALQVLSHDLRSPLTGLSALIALLESGTDGPLSPAQQRRVARIREACDRLAGVVQEIGELALLESGRPAMRAGAVDAASLASRALRDLGPAARGRLIELRLLADPDLPAMEADPHRIERLFRLLLTAALATAEGPVLELSLTPVPGGLEGLLREIRGPRPLEAVQAEGPEPAASPFGEAPVPLPLSASLCSLLAESILRAHGGLSLAAAANGAPETLAAFFLPCRPESPGSNA